MSPYARAIESHACAQRVKYESSKRRVLLRTKLKDPMKRALFVPRPNLVDPQLFGGKSNLSFRSLGVTDFADWQGLRDLVISNLCDADHYVRESDEQSFYVQHSQPHGHCIGAFAGENLVAYAMLRVPTRPDEDNLAKLSQLPPTFWNQAAHLASCMVHPRWRGDHLQVLLLRTRMALALAWGRPLCLAMVSLRNRASRRNLIRQGMQVIWTGWIDGLQRHIMAVNLESACYLPAHNESAITVPDDDFNQMVRLTQLGYVGLEEVLLPQGCGLRFVRATMR